MEDFNPGDLVTWADPERGYQIGQFACSAELFDACPDGCAVVIVLGDPQPRRFVPAENLLPWV